MQSYLRKMLHEQPDSKKRKTNTNLDIILCVRMTDWFMGRWDTLLKDSQLITG